MCDYAIMTEDTADLPEEYMREYDLGMLNLTYTIDEKAYGKDCQLPYKEFYAKMRAGSMPTTSQINFQEAKDGIKETLKKNKDIIYIAFSSGLSGSYNSARLAAEELMEEDPSCRIKVINSLCASLGEGLLVHQAVVRRTQGMPFEELAEWLENNKLNVVHNFTVDDLFHLYRGGRVSKAAAIVGSMINLKPVLHVDEEGHLVAVGKVRGRRKSLLELVDKMGKQKGDWENDIVFISHGDCEEDAKFVADQIKERFGVETFLINPVGPTIGSHAGPGVVALFYMGDYR